MQLIGVVRELSEQLNELKHSSQELLDLRNAIEVSRLPEGVNLQQALSLQYTYLCLVLDIHTPLAYPWSSVFTQAERGMIPREQVESSCAAVLEASRTAILTARQIQVNATCPLQ